MFWVEVGLLSVVEGCNTTSASHLLSLARLNMHKFAESIQIWSAFSFQVVGDDLLMSNPKRIERAVQEAACNSLMLKVPSDWWSKFRLKQVNAFPVF